MGRINSFVVKKYCVIVLVNFRYEGLISLVVSIKVDNILFLIKNLVRNLSKTYILQVGVNEFVKLNIISFVNEMY